MFDHCTDKPTDSQAWTQAFFYDSCHVGSNINPVSTAILVNVLTVMDTHTCNVWKAMSFAIGKCTDSSTSSRARTQVFFADGSHISSYVAGVD